MATYTDTNPASTSLRSGTAKSKAMLALRIVLALAILAGAGFKLSGANAVVQEFNQVGLGQGFRYLTAALEITGAVLLLVPSKIFYGAALLSVVCVGAFFAQLTVLHGDVIHAIVLIAIFAAIAWAYRAQAFDTARR